MIDRKTWIAIALAMMATTVSAEDFAASGIVRPAEEATLAAPIAARIAELTVQEGDSFDKGALLVRFDCARLEADLKAAKSRAAAASVELKLNLERARFQAAGKGEVALSRAQAAAAAAEVEALSVETDFCVLRAPFAGRVGSLMVKRFETPAEYQELMHLIGAGDLEIAVIAPSDWLRWLRVGSPLGFEVRETGSRHRATIARIGASVDPVSQSVNLVARFAEPAPGILPGMSGRALFDGD